MADLITINASAEALPSMIKAAAFRLASAANPAVILVAKQEAGLVFDAARRVARVAAANKAHAHIVFIARKAQTDALEIEVLADRKLADEVDAAQTRGDLSKGGRPGKGRNEELTVRDFGLSRKQLFEARNLRDAITKQPAALRSILEEILASGKEPTRSFLRRELMSVRSGIRRAHPSEKPEKARIEVLSAKNLGRVAFHELHALRQRLEVEARFLALIENHVANVDPLSRIEDVLSNAMLDDLFHRAGGESI